MTVEDICNLTGGILQNDAKIRAVGAATVYPSKVEAGDLFFSNDREEIAKAIDAGAYAIVYDDARLTITDNEIAWILVDEIEEAALRLMRYVVLRKASRFYLLRPHEESFLKMVVTRKQGFRLLEKDWRKRFEQIVNSDATLFLGTDKEILLRIAPDAKRLEEEAEGYLIQDTLLRSTFKADGYIYQEKPLVPFHLPHLLRVMALCKQEALEIDLERLRYTRHFEPLFLNDALEPVAFGKSDKVAIFVDNESDIVEAREYLREHARWARTIVLTPPKSKIEGVERPYRYEEGASVREILKRTHFNYAFIYHGEKQILGKLKADYSLFEGGS